MHAYIYIFVIMCVNNLKVSHVNSSVTEKSWTRDFKANEKSVLLKNNISLKVD